jgi:hypothetical protein
MQTMHHTLQQAINHIPDQTVRIAMHNYLNTDKALENINSIQTFFDRLTESPSSDEQTRLFAHNWSKIHLSSQSVSGLIVRLLGTAEQSQGFRRDHYFMASAQMAHVIAEDTGVHGPSHHRMYETFADTLTGSDEWKQVKYEAPGIKDFRYYVEKSRTKDDVETGILTTFSSEIINTAEYTYANQKIMPWMIQHQSISPNDARRAVAYVHVHAGETELEHAQHAYKAWKFVTIAERKQVNPRKMIEIFDRYLVNMAQTYDLLSQKMGMIQSNDNKFNPRETALSARLVCNWVTP